MDIDVRPLHLRTGNTFRRAPLRSLKSKGAFRHDALLCLTGTSPDALSALGLPNDASVPHSLRKRGRWQLSAALKDDAVMLCECPVRLEEVYTAPRVRKGRCGPRLAGAKQLQRSVQLSGPQAPSNEEELRLRLLQPPKDDQLCRRMRSGLGGCRRKSLRHRKFQVDAWETSDSDGEDASDYEAPTRLSAPTLADFVTERAPSERSIKRKRRHKTAFASLHLPERPSRLPEPLPEDTDDTPDEEERTLNLEDSVVLTSAHVSVLTAQIAADHLRSVFGARLWEAASAPRRFAIDVSGRVRWAAGLAGPRQPETSLAFLLCEVAREEAAVTDLELRVNALLRPGLSEIRVPSFAPSMFAADNCPDFTHFVDACADAVGRTYGESLAEVAPDGQLLQLEPRWLEPLSQGPPKVLLQSAAVHKCSLWRRPLAGNVTVDLWEPLECGICFDAVQASGCRLRCGHGFCESCWRRHLIAEVRRGRLALRCAAHACDEPVDLASALRFVSLAILEQHRRLVLAAALEEGGSTAFCPNAQCHRPLRLRNGSSFSFSCGGDSARTVRCLCGHVSCFACAAEGHWPAPCETFEAYRTAARALGVWRARHESLVVRVKVAGQRCPSCRRFFEKSLGCNDMSCYCGQRFCYACGVKREDHRNPGRYYYPCNTYPSNHHERPQWRLKTRYTVERMKPSRAALNSCPEAFRQALELRQRRLELLGSGFRFRQRFGPVLARLTGARSRYRLEEEASEPRLGWRQLYAGLDDMARAVEFAHVAQNSDELNTATQHRLRRHGTHLRRIFDELLATLEGEGASEEELRCLLREARETLRRMHGPAD